MKTKITSDRISEIVAEMHSITEFAEGSISSSSNSYRLKDGTSRKAKPHWKFQCLGPRGKRKYKNIPAALLPKAKKLVADGRRYGWLRGNGCYISSCHIEAAARILVARRCKQAGMHWRLHNAACVCAIIARLRSAA